MHTFLSLSDALTVYIYITQTSVVVLYTIDHNSHTLLKAMLTIILWLSAFTVYKQGVGMVLPYSWFRMNLD